MPIRCQVVPSHRREGGPIALAGDTSGAVLLRDSVRIYRSYERPDVFLEQFNERKRSEAVMLLIGGWPKARGLTTHARSTLFPRTDPIQSIGNDEAGALPLDVSAQEPIATSRLNRRVP